MADIGPWLDPPAILPGESLPSFALRMAPRGMVSSGEFMRAGLGLSVDSGSELFRSEEDEAIRRLAIMSDADVRMLAENCVSKVDGDHRYEKVKFLGRQIPSSWMIFDRRRLAPGMLCDQGVHAYLPLLWQLAALPCDPHTGEALIDRCECGATLWWKGAARIWLCQNCNADVRTFPRRFVSRETAAVCKEWSDYFLGHAPSLHPDFKHLDEYELFRAMAWFGAFIGSAAGNKRLNASAVNVLRGYTAMKRWPVCFDEEMDEVVSFANDSFANGDPPLIPHQQQVLASINGFISTSSDALGGILLRHCRQTMALTRRTPKTQRHVQRNLTMPGRIPNGVIQPSHFRSISARRMRRARSIE